MKRITLPAIWLLTIIVGLPQFSETIYSPALPDIAKSLGVAEKWVEYTLTVYLAGFAIGTLFFGKFSDKFGRKPCLLFGFTLYIIGCIGCFYSESILALLYSRFIQGLGGSSGSVLGQAICRDAFSGSQRGKVYSTIGSALAISPALGPIIGGVVDQAYGWSSIFLMLILLGVAIFILSAAYLPETHATKSRSKVAFFQLACKLFTDKRVIGYGVLVACSNAIPFSYYAEGSFYLIDMLGLTPSSYGVSFIGVAVAGILGGWKSLRLHSKFASEEIIINGLKLIFAASMIFLLSIVVLLEAKAHNYILICVTLLSMFVITFGNGLVIPNCLATALEHYQYAVGTASAQFGFFYYTLISLFTMGIGWLHNGTLIPMPAYFFTIALIMIITFYKLVRSSKTTLDE